MPFHHCVKMAVDGTPDVLDRHCVVDYRDKVVVEGFCLIAYGVEICLFIFFFFFQTLTFIGTGLVCTAYSRLSVRTISCPGHSGAE